MKDKKMKDRKKALPKSLTLTMKRLYFTQNSKEWKNKLQA